MGGTHCTIQRQQMDKKSDRVDTTRMDKTTGKTKSSDQRQPLIMGRCHERNPAGQRPRACAIICYINDMPSSVQSSIYLFADDAKLYRNIASDDDPPALQHDLQQLEKWSEEWQLHFNPSKCKVMHLGHQNPNRDYTMGATIPQTKNTGYNNQREGSWRVRGHRVNFRETHRDCCKRLLDDLSQITFVLDDMSQKGAICSKIIWTICHNFV